jgi:hypothetical protein
MMRGVSKWIGFVFSMRDRLKKRANRGIARGLELLCQFEQNARLRKLCLSGCARKGKKPFQHTVIWPPSSPPAHR